VYDGGRPHAADFDLDRHGFGSRMRVSAAQKARAGSPYANPGP
jgi:hypothetical protein